MFKIEETWNSETLVVSEEEVVVVVGGELWVLAGRGRERERATSFCCRLPGTPPLPLYKTLLDIQNHQH